MAVRGSLQYNRDTFKPNVLCKMGDIEEIHSRFMVIAKKKKKKVDYYVNF